MTMNLLGGIGLTHLTVYHDVAGPDGVHGGCAHIHALTPEAYFGISGSGAIELHDDKLGYRRQSIHKGTFVQFPPGTLHRSISTDNLEVLAVMGNGGLAERGDARIYFGKEVDDTPGEYEKLRDLVHKGREGAHQRRDLSAMAHAKLVEKWNSDRDGYFAELARFYNVHRKSITANSDEFRGAIEEGPVKSGEQALKCLAALTSDNAVSGIETGLSQALDEEPVFGMCGILHPVHSPRPV
jgi:mannose-6-phosphate isomerase-like protein (cupin superfamily)